MTTATTTTTSKAQRPVTILRKKGTTILKRPRYHVVKNTEDTKPVLLRNLRNYYCSRRRSSIGVNNNNNNNTKKVPQVKSEDTLAATPITDSRKVQFYPRVRVKRIPSRLSYTDEARLSMWIPKKELKQMVSRNYAESAWEGQCWQEAPEEEEWTEQNGKLVHPLYIQAQMWCQEGESEDEAEEESSMDEQEEDDDGVSSD